MKKREILFLTEKYPYPMNGGGKIRDGHILKLLSESAAVEVLCFSGQSAATSNVVQRRKPHSVIRVFSLFRP